MEYTTALLITLIVVVYGIGYIKLWFKMRLRAAYPHTSTIFGLIVITGVLLVPVGVYNILILF